MVIARVVIFHQCYSMAKSIQGEHSSHSKDIQETCLIASMEDELRVIRENSYLISRIKLFDFLSIKIFD